MKKHLHSLIRLILLSTFLLSACSYKADTPTTPYWPTQEWRTSTPEQQGMDSELLAQMMEQIQSKQINLHSMIIVLHGYIVAETYFQPYEADNKVEIYSVTKSIISALVGIAIEQGSIDSVNHKVLDYFPDLTLANNDARKQAITIEHLLTMSSGLEWSDDANYGEMDRSDDWVKYVLDRPMAASPGEQFTYNTGAIHVLSAILRKATGQGPLEFAQANLFGPLGISEIIWAVDPTGLQTGGIGIQITPRDMARFGYLYLRDGVWDGKLIILSSWVKASLEKHIDPKIESDKRAGYGYLWWPNFFGANAAAAGFGGQLIMLVPDQDLEVVFTAGLSPQESQMQADLFESYILPAIKSNDPLPANPTSAARLEELLKVASHPEPKPVSSLSPIAQKISGKTFNLDANNALGIQSFTVTFQGSEALLNVAYSNGNQGEWLVGLDGIYRINPIMIGAEAARGFWQDEKTFVIYFESLSSQDTQIFTGTIDGDTINIAETDKFSPFFSISGIGRLSE